MNLASTCNFAILKRCMKHDFHVKLEMVKNNSVFHVVFLAVTDLLGYVLHLAHGRMAVAAWNSVNRPTYVDVVLLQAHGVRQIHGMPVANGGGA